MAMIVQVQNLDLEQANVGLREFEVWWKAYPARWPQVPAGHFVGPRGQLLSPGEFAVYASEPSRLIFVYSEVDEPAWARYRREAI